MKRTGLLILFLLLLAAACKQAAQPTAEAPDEPSVRPTTNPFFSAAPDEVAPLGETPTAPESPEGGEAEVTDPAVGENAGTPVPAGATPTATPWPTPTPTVTPVRLITHTVFAESLNENWHLENSHWMTVTRQTTEAHSGQAALQFTPYQDFGTIFFSVDEASEMEYPRPRVAGLQFWLNGGEDPVRPEDLAVTIVGSNEYAYWVPGDYSVQSQRQPTFSETRLEFLGLVRDVPPGEWVRIEVRLNELQFDPPYRYVTGFYLKNDRGVLHPFYIDDINLIMVEGDGE